MPQFLCLIIEYMKQAASESLAIAVKHMLHKRSCYFKLHAKLNL